MSRSTEAVTEETKRTMTIYHRILADEKRRIVIEVLNEQPAISLDGLAEEIASRTGESAETVKIPLHHNHVPLLDDVGVLDYERDRGRVTAVPPVLDDVSELAQHTAAVSGSRREAVQ